MCGIVGYIGNKQALPILINGLKVLEYRGYDSAGVAVVSGGKVLNKKSVGFVKLLEEELTSFPIEGKLGIAHTRWATHGEPNKENAHPHEDCSGRVFVVHNGIVENHRELRDYLLKKGHIFKSETDTEVIAHLIENFLAKGFEFKKALLDSLQLIKGAYAIAVVDRDNDDSLYTARFSSPLVIGVGENENFLASDPAALIDLTKKVVYLKDGEVAEITREGIFLTDLKNQEVSFNMIKLEWDLEQAKKGDFPHFMLKEIFEGPEVVRTAFRGRLKSKEGIIKLGGLEQVKDKLAGVKRLIILACGTSYYAGLVGEYIFEEIAGIPVEVHFASEFRYRKEPFEEGTVVLAISQSGETADTLAALEKAKENGLLCLGIVNVVGSTISRVTDAGVYNHAGPEIGVASTKAFLSQLTVLYLMAGYLSKDKNKDLAFLMEELGNIPNKIETILSQADKIEKLADKYKGYDNFLFLGRRYSFPVALEGALKLKEISYVHSEGYGAGEMKHGPLALIDENFPTLAVVPKNAVSDKMYSNIEEIKARRGPVISIATLGDEDIKEISDDLFYIPPTIEPLEPLLAVVPLQLFAYYIGVKRGYDVDKPRNLAKSVTVE